jgi:prepilin-type N-terminal cleavage/methylation domain-containing protein
MSNHQQTSLRRAGFTLVEILVVIAIIAILAALLIPAVMQFTNAGYVATCSNELSQMGTAIEAFKQTYKVKYIPSRLVLREYYFDYQIAANPTPGTKSIPLEEDSVTFLKTIWPNILTPDPATGTTPWTNTNPTLGQTGIDWNGNGKFEIGKAKAIVLYGDQVLVFLLGGIPMYNPNGTQGFSTNARDPAFLQQTTGRKGPFFNFQSNRLVKLATNPVMNNPQSQDLVLFSYLNNFSAPGQTPYALFSNYGKTGGYQPYDDKGNLAPIGNFLPSYSDCPYVQTFNSNQPAPLPYYEAVSPTIRYYNKDSYQIISAGADGVFGSGGLWLPANAANNAGVFGRDDQTNFNGGGVMSAGAN